MKILAIDTSCDDTCCAVVEEKKGCLSIKSNIVSSQVALHQTYGGVFPALAKREHQKNLIPALKQSLKEAGLLSNDGPLKLSPSLNQKIQAVFERDPLLYEQTTDFLSSYNKPPLDLISVTNGPGLEPCLWQGINLAKALSMAWKIPLVGVNHVEAHLLANLLEYPSSSLKMPSLGLVVSGGHTEIVLINQLGQYQIIGATRDDAAGECFDKTARILGLGYPGGPAIAQAAEQPQKLSTDLKITLPRPLIHSRDYDFSFSGLKTAVLYHFQKQPLTKQQSADYVQAMAREVQQSIVDVLVKKIFRAAEHLCITTVLIGGGVASNKSLRADLQKTARSKKIRLFIPSPSFCTDNAAMIAATGYWHQKAKLSNPLLLQAQANLVF